VLQTIQARIAGLLKRRQLDDQAALLELATYLATSPEPTRRSQRDFDVIPDDEVHSFRVRPEVR
jgi:hypothetical protein